MRPTTEKIVERNVMTTLTYELLNLDVWGNETDGFEINESRHSGIFIEVTEKDTAKTVLKKAKKKAGITWKGQYTCIDYDEYYINFNIKKTGKPAIYLDRNDYSDN